MINWSIITVLTTNFLDSLNEKANTPYGDSSIDVYVFPQTRFLDNDLITGSMIILIHEEEDAAWICSVINNGDDNDDSYTLYELFGMSQCFFQHLRLHMFDLDNLDQYVKDNNEHCES